MKDKEINGGNVVLGCAIIIIAMGFAFGVAIRLFCELSGICHG
jgi:hypothetical protein